MALYDEQGGLLADEMPQTAGSPSIMDRLRKGYNQLVPSDATGVHRWTANPLLQMGLGILASQADPNRNIASGALTGLQSAAKGFQQYQRAGLLASEDARREADHQYQEQQREKMERIAPKVGGLLAEYEDVPDDFREAIGQLAEVDPKTALTLTTQYLNTRAANRPGGMHGALVKNKDTGTYWGTKKDGTTFNTGITYPERWSTHKDDNGLTWMIDKDGVHPPTLLQSPEQLGSTAKKIEDMERQRNAARALPYVEREADRLMGLTEELLNHPGRGAGTGMSSVLGGTLFPATEGYNFNVRRQQVMTSVPFIQGIKDLKREAGGVGSITETEGLKIEGLVARANAAVSEYEFINAVRDLQDYLASQVREARRKAGVLGDEGYTGRGSIQFNAQGQMIRQYVVGEIITDPDTGERYKYIGGPQGVEGSYQKID